MLRFPRFTTYFLLCLALARCGPSGSDRAPGYLVVDPEVIKIPADSDTEALLVHNSGGESLSFSIQVAAESADVQWLKVEPESASVEAGGTQSVLVSVINRQQLEPGTYSGKLVVSSAGLESETVLVDMNVGQPILSVDPANEIDFGTGEISHNVIIKNGGDGELVYSLALPGDWVTTEAPLNNSIRPNEPQSVALLVNRDAIPWYGMGEAELVIVSNGLDDSSHEGTVRLSLLAEVDPTCVNLGDCEKAGYYCQPTVEECLPQADPGEKCEENVECGTGTCAAGKCCTTQCDGPCQSCSEADHMGECIDLGEGAACALAHAFGSCS